MGNMPQAALDALKKYRGRPKSIDKHHGFFTENRRKELLGRLDGVKASRGSRLLRAYYSGDALTRAEAMEAMCCQCLGFYADTNSMVDCECPSCPLYQYMPYRKKSHKKGG